MGATDLTSLSPPAGHFNGSTRAALRLSHHKRIFEGVGVPVSKRNRGPQVISNCRHDWIKDGVDRTSEERKRQGSNGTCAKT